MDRGPWESWYHCMCNTYGTWLRGDARGWRERHHRKHVEGDYRKPPAKGTFETIGRRSREMLKRDPVRLESELRSIALSAVVESLEGDGIIVLVACLGATHLHLLAQFKDRRPRQRLGWAKLLATKRVKEFLSVHGEDYCLALQKGEGLWAKRSQCVPVRDRQHRVNTLNYIAAHAKRGAVVWLNPRLPRVVPSI